MKHIIACDCGGTKCAFLLCAEDGTVRASVQGGTANSHFESPESIAGKIRALLSQLREQSGIDPATVVAWGGVIMMDHKLLEPAVNALFPNCTAFFSYGEAPVNLLASAGVCEGCLAHSGTGSFAAAFQDGKDFHYGGLGSYLGDEASGYDIGIHAFNAVKFDLVGLGPHTAMTDMVFAEWQVPRTDFRETVWAYASKCLAVNSESRLRIARLTRVVETAAKAGDGVAKGILQDAAAAMRDQITVLVNMEGYRPEGVLTVSGGTWRCGPDFIDTFARITTEAYPGLHFVYPKFEPIAGVAASILRDALGIAPTPELFVHMPVYRL